ESPAKTLRPTHRPHSSRCALEVPHHGKAEARRCSPGFGFPAGHGDGQRRRAGGAAGLRGLRRAAPSIAGGRLPRGARDDAGRHGRAAHQRGVRGHGDVDAAPRHQPRLRGHRLGHDEPAPAEPPGAGGGRLELLLRLLLGLRPDLAGGLRRAARQQRSRRDRLARHPGAGTLARGLVRRAGLGRPAGDLPPDPGHGAGSGGVRAARAVRPAGGLQALADGHAQWTAALHRRSQARL
ncbi:MAG: Dipeptide-binding ABC transporter, periplasmic substrate-binding component; Putative hemin-binding lipoprotein, partial [uncultured Acetobacteraceae bacterium]